MPVRVDWFDETQTILHWQFSGRWTINELLDVYDEACRMCETVPDRWVHTIADMRETSMMPNLVSSSVANRALRDPKNYAGAFVVTKSGFFRAMVNIMNRIGGSKGKFTLVETMEAAQAGIAEHYKLLPPLSEVGA